jgi:hypothetical protein
MTDATTQGGGDVETLAVDVAVSYAIVGLSASLYREFDSQCVG